jgi:hypothetical protein
MPGRIGQVLVRWVVWRAVQSMQYSLYLGRYVCQLEASYWQRARVSVDSRRQLTNDHQKLERLLHSACWWIWVTQFRHGTAQHSIINHHAPPDACTSTSYRAGRFAAMHAPGPSSSGDDCMDVSNLLYPEPEGSSWSTYAVFSRREVTVQKHGWWKQKFRQVELLLP